MRCQARSGSLPVAHTCFYHLGKCILRCIGCLDVGDLGFICLVDKVGAVMYDIRNE